MPWVNAIKLRLLFAEELVYLVVQAHVAAPGMINKSVIAPAAEVRPAFGQKAA